MSARPQYKAYPTRATLPNRKERKKERNRVFQINYTIRRRRPQGA